MSYEAAIRLLDEHSLWHRDKQGNVRNEPEVADAIRLLGAAGKVKKKDALAWLKLAFVDLDDIPQNEQLKSLRTGSQKSHLIALIESLPEPEEERK